VGTITSRTQTRARSTVHPHGRGDNERPRAAARLVAGSPPRAWGQFWRQRMVRAVVRFTPTGVGTISAPGCSVASSTVHPHGRGDNLPVTLMVVGFVGSPPRAWGQWRADKCVGTTIRFTPTGVGTIWLRRRSGSGRTVHPHGRGDNALTGSRISSFIGSPPRAWGQ